MHIYAIIMHYFSDFDKREALQQEYSQPSILPSPHFRWVVNVCTNRTSLPLLFLSHVILSQPQLLSVGLQFSQTEYPPPPHSQTHPTTQVHVEQALRDAPTPLSVLSHSSPIPALIMRTMGATSGRGLIEHSLLIC